MTHPGRSPRPDYSDTLIRPARWVGELEDVRRLFQGYHDWLARHATGQAGPTGLVQLEREIAELPGAYGPPTGDVLLAFNGSDIVACGALRKWKANVAEFKRIFVRPDHQGPVFGPQLVTALLERARSLGYDRVRVDALPTMEAAIQYYQEMGFKPIPAYWAHPVAGALFFEWTDDHRTRRPTG